MNITRLNKKRIVTNIVILNIVLFLIFIGVSFAVYLYKINSVVNDFKELQKNELASIRKIIARYYEKDQIMMNKCLGMYDSRASYDVYVFEEGRGVVFPKDSTLAEVILKNENKFTELNGCLYLTEIMKFKDSNNKNNYKTVIVVLGKGSLDEVKFAELKKIIYKGAALYLVIAYILSMLVPIISRLNYDKFQTRIFGDLIKHTNDGVIITDNEGKVIFANDSFLEMFKVKLKELLGFDISKFNSSVHNEEYFKAMFGHLNREGNWHGDVINNLSDGSKLYTKLKITAIENSKTKEKYFVCIYENKTETKMQKVDILRLQLYDSYTGLPNRTYTFKYLEKLIDSKAEFVCLNIQIGNFKEVNEQYGFEIGNKLLFQFIEKVKEVFNDKVFIGRIDGRKISVVVEHFAIDGFIDDIKKLAEVSAGNFRIFAENISINAEVAVVFYPEEKLTINEIFEKECNTLSNFLSEKNIAEINKVISCKIAKKNEVIELMKFAVKNNELSLNFQPRVDSNNGRLIAAEALLRWESKKLGTVSPLYFIPLAEETGCIEEISDWTILELCNQLEKWKKELKDIVPVSLNISPVYLMKENLHEKLISELSRHNLLPADLQIEITERAVNGIADPVKNVINRMAKDGIRILIDNFGTGNSKLDYLKNIEISMLKIDREFIKNYPEKDDGSIAKVIIDMANSLQIGVVGEGAENDEQIDFLRRNGCSIVQGYYYSRPLSADKFAELIVDKRV